MSVFSRLGNRSLDTRFSILDARFKIQEKGLLNLIPIFPLLKMGSKAKLGMEGI